MSDSQDSNDGFGPAYAISRLCLAPVVLIALLGRTRIAVSAGRERGAEWVWRFQFTHRAILRMTDDGEWSWHTVTRNTRLEVEPLIVEALTIAAAAPAWIAALDPAGDPPAPNWTQIAAKDLWPEGAAIGGGQMAPRRLSPSAPNPAGGRSLADRRA